MIEQLYDPPVADDNEVLVAIRERKSRGAFFTPPVLANFLVRWAIHGNPHARILDPTCGEGVFLLAAARQLRELGTTEERLDDQVHGVDVHDESLAWTSRLLEQEGLDANLTAADFFELASPDELFAPLGLFDAVVGNPPFIRYQHHNGQARRVAAMAALRQGVRLSGLASSWAPLLVHAGSFLRPEGRLAMVLPAELLTVGYAEPVRRWLRERFAAVKLVFFERRQFADTLENVVLLLAQGTGGCDAFSLYYVHDGEDLARLQPFEEHAVKLSDEGKWTDLVLTIRERQAFKAAVNCNFVRLGDYGSPELGTVTGANSFFTLSEETRRTYRLEPGQQVFPTCPPGTRHLRGLRFTLADWEELRDAGEAVWILHPTPQDMSLDLHRYLAIGEALGVPGAYKCKVRSPWWRPPVVAEPDLFFTYMSHRYPRLITNSAGVTFLNSMHGIRLRAGKKKTAKHALPLLAMNSITMLGAELYGRSYGGGVLKMEPREAARLPLPNPEHVDAAWERLKTEQGALDEALRAGSWLMVLAHVDRVLLREVMGVPENDIHVMTVALNTLRKRRISQDSTSPAVRA